jgi:hypothetical protein
MSHIPMIENKDLLATMGSQYGLCFWLFGVIDHTSTYDV